MGVPGFFMWLLKKYKSKKFVFTKSQLDIMNEKDKIQNEEINSIDYLLIDMNCMIHPECFKTLADAKPNENMEKLEAKMRNNVILYLEKTINHLIPKKGIYIAIDGVAPVAKMKQQRLRRFKSISDKQLYDNIRKKHNKTIPMYWNNSAITPGTDFMLLLTNRIKQWMEEYAKIKKLEIIFSPSNIPGEGEHKLLQFIRDNIKLNKFNSYAIYGLDADLIFLALATNLDSIYLMRESKEMDNKDMSGGFNFVSIKIMKECIVDTFHKEIIKNDKNELIQSLNNNRLIDDFIFMCYLTGNDFLPHLPSLNIYNGAIDLLIEKYCKIIIMGHSNIPDSYIVTRIPSPSINMKMFFDFLSLLADEEESILKINYNKKQYSPQCISTDPFDIEMHRIDNMKFKVNDPIMIGMDNMKDWRERYYMHYYKVNPEDIDQFTKNMAMDYMKGLKWVTCYYFDKCPEWDWHYKYNIPPFLLDIKKMTNYSFDNIMFIEGNPMTPFEQLLTVLPRQSSYLLPVPLRKIMLNNIGSASYLYPLTFELDMIGRKKYWMVQPILPEMDIELIRHMFKKYSNKLDCNMRQMNTNMREPLISIV